MQKYSTHQSESFAKQEKMIPFLCMQLSSHYRPFTHKTVIAITNNEFARLLSCTHDMVEELEKLTTPATATGKTHGANANTEQDFDDMKDHRLVELYHALSDKLRELLDHGGFEEAIVCVPEINKNLFTEAMHPDILKRLKQVVPKNLASMDLPNIMRILLEA